MTVPNGRGNGGISAACAPIRIMFFSHNAARNTLLTAHLTVKKCDELLILIQSSALKVD
jgi:hypothetical protein